MYLLVQWNAHIDDKGRVTGSDLEWKESEVKPVVKPREFQWLFWREPGLPSREIRIVS